MKTSGSLLFAISIAIYATLGLAVLNAKVAASEAAQRPEDVSGDKKAALERLKQSFKSVSEFDETARQAQKAGVPQQTIDEIRLLVSIKTRNLDAMPETLANLDRKMNTWRGSDSLAFRNKLELQGTMFLAKSLVANEANNDAEFEKSVKEAFWADPKLGEILAEEVNSRRTKQKLVSLVVPLDLPLETSSGDKTSLADLLRGEKAVLLDFWASWCGPCMALMDDLVRLAHTLSAQHVAVVGINTESSDKGGPAEAKKKAEQVKKTKKVDFAWVLEPADRPYSRLLEIDTIPHAVLVAADGKILFDGHPADPELGAALTKINVNLAAKDKMP